MQHLQSIPTCEDIVEEAYLWEEDFPSLVQPSRNSTPKALWNHKSWVSMTSCWRSVGLDTSAQGYQVQHNVLFQDNKSTILFGKEWKGFEQQAYKARQYWVFLYYRSRQQGQRIIGLVSNQRDDWRLHDQTPIRCSVLEVQRPDHGSGSCTGSRNRKSQNKDR
jgi:hypothetical protein